MKLFNSIFFLLAITLNLNCQTDDQIPIVEFGADVLVSDKLDFLERKNVGLLINHTSLLKNGTSLFDTLQSLSINITTVFSPEHGIRGNIEAGELIEYKMDTTDIKYYSLYGNIRKPTDDLLNNLDVIVVDLQDIGARFYTYISTMYYVLEAASENNISIIVLDRPNPLNGNKIEGPVLNKKFRSFIGIDQLPVVHGMTIGELSLYFKDTIENSSETNVDLRIIKMNGWERKLSWNELNRAWIATSPNIPDFETAIIYPGTCLLEATNISEGRGTDDPFKTIGAPFINSLELISELQKLNINGVNLSPVSFTPKEIMGKVRDPKYEGINCNGIKIGVDNYKLFNSFDFGVKLIYTLQKLYTEKFEINNHYFDKLVGNSEIRKMIIASEDLDLILNSWQAELDKFKEKRKKYLLY